jgi:hypothetical protein
MMRPRTVVLVASAALAAIACSPSQESPSAGAQDIVASPAILAPPPASSAPSDAKPAAPAATAPSSPPPAGLLFSCTEQGNPSSSALVKIDERLHVTWNVGGDEGSGDLFVVEFNPNNGAQGLLLSTGFTVEVDPLVPGLHVSGRPEFECDPPTMKTDADALDRLMDLSDRAFGQHQDLAECGSDGEITELVDSQPAMTGGALIQWGGPAGRFYLQATSVITASDGSVTYKGVGAREVEDDSPPFSFTEVTTKPLPGGKSAVVWHATDPAGNPVPEIDGCNLPGADFAKSLIEAPPPAH